MIDYSYYEIQQQIDGITARGVGGGAGDVTLAMLTTTSGDIVSQIVPSFQLFNANMVLDLSEDPTSVSVINNKGLLSGAQFDVIGSWSRQQTANGGYYWQKGDNNVGGLRHRPLHSHDVVTATMDSLNTGSWTDTVVITDTANDLQALFGYKGRDAGGIARDGRKFKITIWTTSAGSFIYGGHIGEITKNGDEYTLKIYIGTSSFSQGCMYGTGTQGTDFHWKIHDDGLSGGLQYDANGTGYGMEGLAFSLWYYPAAATTNSVYLMGLHDDWITDAPKLCGPIMQQYLTDYVVRLQTTTPGSPWITLDSECLATNQWVHLFANIPGAYSNFPFVRMYANGMITIDTGSYWNVSAGIAGSLSIACPMHFTGAMNPMTTGSRIAYPRFWNKSVTPDKIEAVYQYERGLLGV